MGTPWGLNIIESHPFEKYATVKMLVLIFHKVQDEHGFKKNKDRTT